MTSDEMTKPMRLLLWNVEWGEKPACVNYVNDLIAREPLDLICLTESTTEFLHDRENVLRSTGDYGYANPGNRQKVCLWSRFGWSDIDYLGSEALPPGRFLSGVTNGIRIVGVCIPWHDAHVSSGTRNRKRWEDHKAYLAGLRPILERYVAEGRPVCLLGDYNQRIPPIPFNAEVYPALQAVIGSDLVVRTADVCDADGEMPIDHLASTRDLQFQLERSLSRKNGDGQELSDHSGCIGRLSREESRPGTAAGSSVRGR